MTVGLLIFHGLAAVMLLGALTHQVLAAGKRLPAQQTFVASVRRVRPEVYAGAIVVLYVVTWMLGMVLYPAYTLGPRPGFELDHPLFFGLFEIKEHFASLGAGMLPAYWHLWRTAAPKGRSTARILGALLALIVWYDFIVGHVLNNLKGL